MTEIPEHLLKRAQARRAAAAGAKPAADAPAGDAPAAAAGEAAAAPAAAVAKAPAPLPTLEQKAEAPKPDIPVVAAAKRRKRVPYWAAPILVLLPVWGLIYRDATIPPSAVETDPIVIGNEVFHVTGGCAGCHTADGSGGAAGAQLKDGHALETFPDPLQMVHWVAFGHAGAAYPDGSYGEGVRRPKITGAMPAFHDKLTPEQIAAVVIYVRSQFSPDQYDPTKEQGFTAENYEADPDAIAAEVEAVIEKGEGPAPDLSDITRAGT
ncbi:MAG: c-type cytochrome [Acidimicrobiales bacterium]|nr:c-type cytochrome [Acidimicrobiales bacterium]